VSPSVPNAVANDRRDVLDLAPLWHEPESRVFDERRLYSPYTIRSGTIVADLIV
jgi:hypothetical protein